MNNDVSEWAVVCIKLLQGPIIQRSEQDKIWNLLLRNRSYIDNYFSTIGITLLVEESDGYAFLRQKNESEDEDFEQLPRLIRRYRLSIEESFLCVILREALDYFETSDDVSEIFTMKESEIMERLKELWATGDTQKVTDGVLGAEFIWGEDLHNVKGLAELVKKDLDLIH